MMRGFFFLLVLTNIAYFAWQYFYQQPEEAQNSPIVVQGDKLILLSELSSENYPLLRQDMESEASRGEAKAISQAHADTSEGDPAANEASGCLVISDIQQRERLDELTALLQQQGFTGLEQGDAAGIRNNYWVMLPVQKSRKEAEDIARLLSQRRLKDFFIVRSGEYENAISLGVFSTEERAQRHLQEIRALDQAVLKPRIEQIELPTRVYWLRLGYEEGQLEALSSLLEGEDFSLEKSCD